MNCQKVQEQAWIKERGYLDQTVFVMTSQQQNQGNYDYNVWDITVECC